MAIKDERQEQQTKLKTSHLCETCPSVPNEIIVEILLKLPVGSLLRFKSVCKLWQSLISDPYFIKTHLSLATSNPHYIHHRLITEYDFSSCRLNDVMFDKPITVVKDHQFKHSPRELNRILGSCNGLLFINHQNNRLVWNPSTGRSSKLVPYDGMPSVYACYIRYGFGYGFGYDESTDDYKVVLIKDAKSVKMYSVKFGSWKDCDDFPTGIHPNYHSGTYLKGYLHWAGYEYYKPLRIVSFDLEKETYGEILPPVYHKGRECGFTLGVLGEWLCVVCIYPKDRVDVWVMKVYGVKDSWTKLVSVPYSTLSIHHERSVPLCMSDDGKVLLKLGDGLVKYDSKNNSVSHIRELDYTGSFRHTFVESLVSPDPLSTITM